MLNNALVQSTPFVTICGPITGTSPTYGSRNAAAVAARTTTARTHTGCRPNQPRTPLGHRNGARGARQHPPRPPPPRLPPDPPPPPAAAATRLLRRRRLLGSHSHIGHARALPSDSPSRPVGRKSRIRISNTNAV